MNFEFLVLNVGLIRNIQFLFFGMFLMFVFYSCQSAQTKVPAKLDLSEERQLVKDLQNLEPEQKVVILKAFDKADSVNESIRIYAKQLEEQNAKLKADLESEKEDASAYRKWRNWIIGCLVLFGLYVTSSFWLPIAKRLIGIPL